MGNIFNSVGGNDFYWDLYTDEPHASRRKLILAKYPQVKKLMGNDWRISLQLFLMVMIQLCMVYIVQDYDWPKLILFAYVIGGTLNHSLSLGLHEVAHNLAFGAKYPLSNRILGFFGNLPIGAPVSVTFKKYHLDHHKYQGDEQLDVDLPTKLEGILFSSYVGKFVFVLLQPLFYSFRPLIVLPKMMTGLEAVNWIVQLTFDAIILYNFGWRSLAYLLLGTVLGLGLHPIAGHFIAEHYVFTKGFETYSYYGPLNLITFNVGYHNEHHDFPNIPGYRLPELRKLAPEFYDNLPCYNSWIKVLYDFIVSNDVGPYSRIKRPTKMSRELAISNNRNQMLLEQREEKDN